MKRLLYVEDNLVTQKLVKRQLDVVGEVCTAASLSAARLMLQEQAFDLVLADVNLPDGNSMDLVLELRTRYSAQQLPVILVSSSMDQRLKARSLQAGANDCFPMPTPWATLLAAVRHMLNHPYVRPNNLGVITATFVEGTANNRFWVYCPELDLRLEGESPEGVRQSMVQRVQRTVARGDTLPFVSRVKLTERLVETYGGTEIGEAGRQHLSEGAAQTEPVEDGVR